MGDYSELVERLAALEHKALNAVEGEYLANQLRLARHAIETLQASQAVLLAQLERMTAHYVQLAGCGDCGNWNPEDEEEVKAARNAIAQAKGE